MILTVTLNPARDVTYRLDALRPGEVHRVTTVLERPGGKGINVARVLHSLGADVTATGFSGGPGGRQLEQELMAEGIGTTFVDALPDLRRTLVVHGDDGTTTSLWEPGRAPADPYAAEEELLTLVQRLLGEAHALVVSGSHPAGIDARLPARLAAMASASDVPTVADVSGDALRYAADDRCSVLMPNREELSQLIGRPLPDISAVRAAATELCARGVPAVVATSGAEGALLQVGDRTWQARPVERVAGNPTGAGDAAAAAVAAGLAERAPWPDVLKSAVALSAAAVRRPVAGEVDLDAYRMWREQVVVHELTATQEES